MPITVKAIQEQRGALHDKATALANLAEKESRDLTEAEKTEFDQIMAQHKALEADLTRAQWREDEEARLASLRIDERIRNGDARGTGGQRIGDDGANTGDLLSTIRVPARARLFAPQRMRSFTGPTAVEEAYISGQWILANLYHNRNASKWCRDHGLSVRDAMTTGDDSLGGVLVPEEFSATLIRLVEQYGVFRQKARKWPMKSDEAVIPRRIGGTTVYFVGDNQEITASDMTTDAIRLIARKVAALVKWSSEIDEDSAIQVADMLATEIAYNMAVKEDACGFLGTGTSTYGGMSGLITACTAATATIVTAITGNTAYSTLDLADFESMIGKLPEFGGIQPEWYISKAGWAASMMRLADAAGGVTAEEIEGARRRMFLGYPVNIVQTMNTTLAAQTATGGLCYFGDLGMAATMGTRREVSMMISDQRYFEYDQLAIKATSRFGINIHDVGDTSNPGAMVMLKTPAS